MDEKGDILSRIKKLNTIGIALSAEKNTSRLLEMILDGAKSITHADGGTIYLVTEARQLEFAVMKTSSLDISIVSTAKGHSGYPPIPLFDDSGNPNIHMVAAYAVHNDRTVNIPDAYDADGFDFSGTMEFDNQTGYRSRSFLTIPMKNHENEVIGVMQLINAVNTENTEIVAFTQEDQQLAESLASQAAIALTNNYLMNELRTLFETFIEVIASAIDEKSPYTGGHCRRVPELTMMLTKAAIDSKHGPLKDFHLTDEQLYEIRIAGLLHDCGKITTPVHIVDKATKLETIFDRVNLINTRFEIMKRDAEIDLLKRKLEKARESDPGIWNEDEEKYKNTLVRLEDDKAFIQKCNIGGEFMSGDDKKRVQEIANHQWVNSDGRTESLLSENECYNLCVSKGTLTAEERDIINHHIVSTISILEKLPFPKYLQNVAEIAGGHHERMDGKGYPRGLTREQLSIPARIMGIADIFEALTAADRPYKDGMKLSQALNILGRMKLDSHIDPDLFDIFINSKIYLDYARKFLKAEQLDEVDVTKIVGYQ